MTMPSIPASDIQCSIDVILKSNWDFEEHEGVFRGPRGKSMAVSGLFPPGVLVTHKVPHFVGRPRRDLSPAERDLCRYLQVQFPPDVDPQHIINALAKVSGIESAALGVRCELPATMPSLIAPPAMQS